MIINKPFLGSPLNLGHLSTKGIVGYWPGTPALDLVDFSLRRNNGTITGPTWQSGGLLFDADADTVTLGAAIAPFLTTDMTIAFSIFIDSFNATNFVACIDRFARPFRVTLDSGSHIEFTTRRDGLQTIETTVQSTGEWIHCVCVSIGGTPEVKNIYVNGIFNKTGGSSNGNLALDGSSLTLGQDETANPAAVSFRGKLRDVILYNRALTASESMQQFINPNLPIRDDSLTTIFGAFTAAAPSGIPILRRRRECA